MATVLFLDYAVERALRVTGGAVDYRLKGMVGSPQGSG